MCSSDLRVLGVKSIIDRSKSLITLGRNVFPGMDSEEFQNRTSKEVVLARMTRQKH